MQLVKVEVKSFRLLQKVELSLEQSSTVIVGRNNSGKTSLTELFRRLLSESPRFQLEDFSVPLCENFLRAFELHRQGAEEADIRQVLPQIEATFVIAYDVDAEDLGVLSDFIVDLNPESNRAVAQVIYRLRDGEIENLFKDTSFSSEAPDVEQQRSTFFKILKERLPRLYSAVLFACDPADASNRKSLELSFLRSLFHAGFINAQRGLDDSTHKERDVLGKTLERLLSTASSETATEEDRKAAKNLDNVVNEIQTKIDTDFKGHLRKLLPALQLFGYPGLNDPHLQTETTLDVQRLLENHTKLRYAGANGIGLPETYNGLGSRNLIYILLQLFEFFKAFQAKQTAPAVHMVFIEEPEAHLHPQMQEVFIRKLDEIAKAFVSQLNDGKPWPVQFVVSTHSTHIANEAPFEAVRYFLNVNRDGHQTAIKDLRVAFTTEPLSRDKEFLHKFLTLTHCDLFFADKAILIEGPTERLLMPKMIEKIDAGDPNLKLGIQYISVVEAGGAHVQNFFEYLDFLELPTLVISDLDTVKAVTNGERTTWKKCKVSEGTRTCNSGLKKWFGDEEISPQILLQKTDDEKIKKCRRVCFQVPEGDDSPCGRSFEEAFMLANATLFEVVGATAQEREDAVWAKASEVKKTDFALKYGIETTDWIVPKYIKDGLKWLAELPAICAAPDPRSPELRGPQND